MPGRLECTGLYGIGAQAMDRTAPKVMIPTWVVATSPFTIITLNKEDELNASLEDINRSTYDHLKICRTTMPIDSGIEAMNSGGMAAIVSYTSSFIFPRIPKLDKQEIVKATNKILLQLMFGGIHFDAVAPADIGGGMLYGTGYFLASGTASGAAYSLLMALQHRDVSSFDSIRLIRPRTYTKAEISEAISKGRLVTDKMPEINPSILLEGVTHFERFQLASALIFLWSASEAMIGRIWNDKIVPAGVGIPGRRQFVESNSWQAAYKAEVLFQTGAIDERLYGLLNGARMARNALAHKGTAPSLTVCEQALEAAFALISLVATDYQRDNEFVQFIDRLKQVHRPPSGPLAPQFWRPIPSVPGDDKWGDAPYPRYPEIELVPLERDQNKKDRQL